MASLDDSQKLRGDVLRDDLETYRKIENWGASLFLGSIGLTFKQLLEWDRSCDATKRLILPDSAFILPAFIGIVAFVFLRVVNFRSHKVATQLHKLSGNGTGASLLGSLGWIIAMIPLVFGYSTAWYLSVGIEPRQSMLRWVIVMGCVLLVLALFRHIQCRRKESAS